jgi:hypothetical protein
MVLCAPYTQQRYFEHGGKAPSILFHRIRLTQVTSFTIWQLLPLGYNLRHSFGKLSDPASIRTRLFWGGGGSVTDLIFLSIRGRVFVSHSCMFPTLFTFEQTDYHGTLHVNVTPLEATRFCRPYGSHRCDYEKFCLADRR